MAAKHVVCDDGTEEWRLANGQLHREGDQPAITRPSGRQEWWKNGKRHRDGDLPALIHANGKFEWWVDGARCRSGDKPSVVRGDGTQEWWVGGVLHRTGGKPALMRADGAWIWYEHGFCGMRTVTNFSAGSWRHAWVTAAVRAGAHNAVHIRSTGSTAIRLVLQRLQETAGGDETAPYRVTNEYAFLIGLFL